MASTKTAQEAPKEAFGKNPFVQGFDLWNRMAQQHLQRLQDLHEDLAEFEKLRREQARRFAAEMATTTSENLAFMTRIATSWHKGIWGATGL